MIDNNKIIGTLEKILTAYGGDVKIQNVGTVIKNTDGVITASGLSRAIMGEKVTFFACRPISKDKRWCLVKKESINLYGTS